MASRQTSTTATTVKRQLLSSKPYKSRRSMTKLYGDTDAAAAAAPAVPIVVTHKPSDEKDGGDDTDKDVNEIDDTEDVILSVQEHLDAKNGGVESNLNGLSVENVERVRLIVRRIVERRKSSRVALFEEHLSDSPSSTSVEVSTVTSERDDDAAARKQEVFKRRLAQIFGEEDEAAAASRAQQDKIKQHQSVTVKLRGKDYSIPWWIMLLVLPPTILPQSYGYICWLAIITCAFLYNAFAIPLRTLFDVQTVENCSYWLLADYVCDGIYLIDMLRVRPLLKFVRDGLFIDRRTETALNYFRSRLFCIDLLALLPLDLLYIFSFGQVVPAVRLNRMLKAHCYWEFFDRVETIASIPNVLRIFKTVTYMLYLVHINSGMYYSISYYERTVYGNTNEWVFVGTDQRHAYIRCTYQALKMAIKIGHNPIPFNSRQRAFHTFSLLMGIFVFAILVGQIRDIYSSISAREAEFRRKLDLTIRYLQKLRIPHTTIEKVRAWFIYSWKFQKTLDENDYLAILPRKLKTDLAVNVHYNTIAKVQLFQDVEQGLISELVLMLKPRLYLPNEYVCRRGEVGKEMFIIKYGLVEVVGGGPGEEKVLATLGEGTVIGEIALLSLGGDNRRTAHVRSKGLSQLFVLSKEDLETALQDYPTTQDIIKKKARAIIRQNEKKRRAAAPQQAAVNNAEKTPVQPEKKISVQHHTGNTEVHDGVHKPAATEQHHFRNLLHSHSVAGGAGEHALSHLFAKFLPRAGAMRQQLGTSEPVVDAKQHNAPSTRKPCGDHQTSPPLVAVTPQHSSPIKTVVTPRENGTDGINESFHSRAMRRKTIVSPAALKAMRYVAGGVNSPSICSPYTKRSASANEPLNEARLWPLPQQLESPTELPTPTSATSALVTSEIRRGSAAMRRLQLQRSRRLAAKSKLTMHENHQNSNFEQHAEESALSDGLKSGSTTVLRNTRLRFDEGRTRQAHPLLRMGDSFKSGVSNGRKRDLEQNKLLLSPHDGSDDDDHCVQMVTVL